MRLKLLMINYILLYNHPWNEGMLETSKAKNRDVYISQLYQSLEVVVVCFILISRTFSENSC